MALIPIKITFGDSFRKTESASPNLEVPAKVRIPCSFGEPVINSCEITLIRVNGRGTGKPFENGWHRIGSAC